MCEKTFGVTAQAKMGGLFHADTNTLRSPQSDVLLLLSFDRPHLPAGA